MKKPQTAHILTLMVDNEFGVLTRITSQIRREGWNIKSLAVAEGLDPAISRITLMLECFDTTLQSAIQRLARLACVREVTPCKEDTSFIRELLVARIPKAALPNCQPLLTSYGASILDENDVVTLQLTGKPEVLDAFAGGLKDIPDVRMARTGPIVLD